MIRLDQPLADITGKQGLWDPSDSGLVLPQPPLVHVASDALADFRADGSLDDPTIFVQHLGRQLAKRSRTCAAVGHAAGAHAQAHQAADADEPTCELEALLIAKKKKHQENEAKKARVGEDMKVKMDAGVRVNPGLKKALLGEDSSRTSSGGNQGSSNEMGFKKTGDLSNKNEAFKAQVREAMHEWEVDFGANSGFDQRDIPEARWDKYQREIITNLEQQWAARGVPWAEEHTPPARTMGPGRQLQPSSHPGSQVPAGKAAAAAAQARASSSSGGKGHGSGSLQADAKLSVVEENQQRRDVQRDALKKFAERQKALREREREEEAQERVRVLQQFQSDRDEQRARTSGGSGGSGSSSGTKRPRVASSSSSNGGSSDSGSKASKPSLDASSSGDGSKSGSSSTAAPAAVPTRPKSSR